MRYIFQGIKDYCKDCWHDFLFRHLLKFYKKCPKGVLLDAALWKEGNLWHYIRQRILARKVQK